MQICQVKDPSALISGGASQQYCYFFYQACDQASTKHQRRTNRKSLRKKQEDSNCPTGNINKSGTCLKKKIRPLPKVQKSSFTLCILTTQHIHIYSKTRTDYLWHFDPNHIFFLTFQRYIHYVNCGSYRLKSLSTIGV